MSTPYILSKEKSAGNKVTKYEFKHPKDILSQGLHFIPGDEISSILNHSHTGDSEKYYRLKINKTKNGQITSMEWEPLPAVSASTPDQNSHSVESSDEMQIIFGVKRSKEYNNTYWPEDILPEVSYDNDYHLFKFTLGDETIYIDDIFENILSENDIALYSRISGADNSKSDVNYIRTAYKVNLEKFRNFFSFPVKSGEDNKGGEGNKGDEAR